VKEHMRPKAREQAVIDVLSGSAGGEGWWKHDEFFEAWKGDLYDVRTTARTGSLAQVAQVCATVNSSCCYIEIVLK
jgi:hypothetical protein